MSRASPHPSRRRPFEHEWLLEPFERHTSFSTRRMFGGLAVYLYDRLMLVLVEPTKSGRWQWHGVLVCTDHAQHAAIRAGHPQLAPHEILGKWLFLDSHHEDFEPVMTSIVAAMARNDSRFGVVARPPRGAPARPVRPVRPVRPARRRRPA